MKKSRSQPFVMVNHIFNLEKIAHGPPLEEDEEENEANEEQIQDFDQLDLMSNNSFRSIYY